MSVIGFALISTAPAREQEIYNKLKTINEIVEVHPLFGEYDIIAKIEAESFDLLSQIIIEKIRSIEGMVDTKTLTGASF